MRRVERFDRMFQGATSFNRDLSGWAVAPSATTVDMFAGATAYSPDHALGSRAAAAAPAGAGPSGSGGRA